MNVPSSSIIVPIGTTDEIKKLSKKKQFCFFKHQRTSQIVLANTELQRYTEFKLLQIQIQFRYVYFKYVHQHNSGVISVMTLTM